MIYTTCNNQSDSSISFSYSIIVVIKKFNPLTSLVVFCSHEMWRTYCHRTSQNTLHILYTSSTKQVHKCVHNTKQWDSLTVLWWQAVLCLFSHYCSSVTGFPGWIWQNHPGGSQTHQRWFPSAEFLHCIWSILPLLQDSGNVNQHCGVLQSGTASCGTHLTVRQ